MKQLIEQVGDLERAILGGNGASAGDLLGRVVAEMGDVAHSPSGMLGWLGGGGAPAPSQVLIEQAANMAGVVTRPLEELLDVGWTLTSSHYHLAAQPLAAFHHDSKQAVAGLIERSAAAAGEVTRAAGRALGSGESSGSGGGVPAVPPAAPLGPTAPGGYSSSSLVGLGSGADAFKLLFAVVTLYSAVLLQGGRLSWLRRESHGPPTALALAIERPG